MKVLLFLIAIVAIVQLDPFVFTFCLPKDKSQFVVSNMDITPKQPKGGDNLIVDFIGDVVAPAITEGTVDVIVQMQSTIFDTYHYNFCDVMASGCPIQPGTNKGQITHIVPKLLLPGWYNLTTIVKIGEKEITCVSTNIQLIW